MTKRYLALLLLAMPFWAKSQSTKQSEELSPTLSQNLQPVSKGDTFFIQTTASLQKTHILPVNAVRLLGAGISAYGASRMLSRPNGGTGKSRVAGSQSWLIPAGVALTLSADKLVSKYKISQYVK